MATMMETGQQSSITLGNSTERKKSKVKNFQSGLLA